MTRRIQRLNHRRLEGEGFSLRRLKPTERPLDLLASLKKIWTRIHAD